MPTPFSLQAPDNDVSFFDLVYDVVRLIPAGKVTSYGAIAKYLGANRSSRLVGWALNNSLKLEPPVPAHRVVNRNGLLTGRAAFNPPERMAELLEKEGIKVADNQVQQFKKHFWDPAIELDIEK